MTATWVRQDFELIRGDTWGWDGVTETLDAVTYPLGLLSVGAVMRCTIKKRIASADPIPADLAAAALGDAQVNSSMDVNDGNGGITIITGVTFYVEFPPAISELFPVDDEYDYDVTVDFSSTESFTLVRGVIRCLADVTQTRV